jgi:hypothetical protein
VLVDHHDELLAAVRVLLRARDGEEAMSSNHDLRHAHEDARNEAAIRVRVLAAQETHARDTALRRLVGVLVQRPEPHHFHACPVLPLSPRRGWGYPDAPGTQDTTGFSDGLV